MFVLSRNFRAKGFSLLEIMVTMAVCIYLGLKVKESGLSVQKFSKKNQIANATSKIIALDDRNICLTLYTDGALINSPRTFDLNDLTVLGNNLANSLPNGWSGSITIQPLADRGGQVGTQSALAALNIVDPEGTSKSEPLIFMVSDNGNQVSQSGSGECGLANNIPILTSACLINGMRYFIDRSSGKGICIKEIGLGSGGQLVTTAESLFTSSFHAMAMSTMNAIIFDEYLDSVLRDFHTLLIEIGNNEGGVFNGATMAAVSDLSNEISTILSYQDISNSFFGRKNRYVAGAYEISTYLLQSRVPDASEEVDFYYMPMRWGTPSAWMTRGSLSVPYPGGGHPQVYHGDPSTGDGIPATGEPLFPITTFGRPSY